MDFINTQGHDLYWTTSRTNKELYAWCQENGIKLPKSSTKDTFCIALKDHMVACGIDLASHPDYIRARG